MPMICVDDYQNISGINNQNIAYSRNSYSLDYLDAGDCIAVGVVRVP
jgi:hypothetical protein